MFPWRNAKRFFYKTLRQPGYAFKVFNRRLNAFLYYHFGNGTSSLPEAITLFLTHRCNLHCRMCGQWGDGGITKKKGISDLQQELSFDELRAVVDQVSSFRPNMTLFGGEPLLHKHATELIAYIKRKGLHCLIITNGSLLSQVAENLVDIGLDELNVSLDGNGTLHDSIRGMPGLFNKIMQGLQLVNHFKVIKKKKKPLINLQTTINKLNYQQLEEMIDVARGAQAASLTFHNLIFLNQAIIEKQKAYDIQLGCSSLDWEGFDFSPDIDPEKLFLKMQEINSSAYPFSVDFYPNFSQKALVAYYRNPFYIPTEYTCRCLSPWVVAYVFPDGEVRPCLNLSYSYGTIKGHTFREVWNSLQAQKYRRFLREKQLFPVCVRCTELYRY